MSKDFFSNVTTLAQPGDRVRWRDFQHTRCLGWDESYGLGPFEVLRVVDRSSDKIPPGLVLNTKHGEREISSVWFTLEPETDHAGHVPAGLSAIGTGFRRNSRRELNACSQPQTR